jgi:hypothetical protein
VKAQQELKKRNPLIRRLKNKNNFHLQDPESQHDENHRVEDSATRTDGRQWKNQTPNRSTRRWQTRHEKGKRLIGDGDEFCSRQVNLETGKQQIKKIE